MKRKIAFLACCMVMLSVAGARGIVTSDSRSNALANWWATHELHPRAKVCGAVVPPGNMPFMPHLFVVRRTAWNAADMGGVDTRNCRYDPLTRRLYVYCGPGQNLDVEVTPNLVSSSFSVRAMHGFTQNAGGTVFWVWGYYCTSTGCYGSRPGGTGITAAANANDLEFSVTAICRR